MRTGYNMKQRLFSSVLLIAALFIMIFSFSFLIHSAHHDCSGENCPVCADIRSCEERLRQDKAIAEITIRPDTIKISLTNVVFHEPVYLMTDTPITGKVRLND